MGTWRYQKGASWFEFAVVSLVYSVVLAILLNRLHYYQEVAERTSMEYVAVMLKSTLRLRMAELMIGNREAEIPALADQNPISWLETPLLNYCGAVDSDPGPEMQTGCWYYVRGVRGMTYLASRSGNFLPDSTGRKRVRYRMAVLKDGLVTPSVEFRLVEPYHWLE